MFNFFKKKKPIMIEEAVVYANNFWNDALLESADLNKTLKDQLKKDITFTKVEGNKYAYVMAEINRGKKDPEHFVIRHEIKQGSAVARVQADGKVLCLQEQYLLLAAASFHLAESQGEDTKSIELTAIAGKCGYGKSQTLLGSSAAGPKPVEHTLSYAEFAAINAYLAHYETVTYKNVTYSAKDNKASVDEIVKAPRAVREASVPSAPEPVDNNPFAGMMPPGMGG